LSRIIPAHRQELLPINEKALRQGAEWALKI